MIALVGIRAIIHARYRPPPLAWVCNTDSSRCPQQVWTAFTLDDSLYLLAGMEREGTLLILRQAGKLHR